LLIQSFGQIGVGDGKIGRRLIELSLRDRPTALQFHKTAILNGKERRTGTSAGNGRPARGARLVEFNGRSLDRGVEFRHDLAFSDGIAAIDQDIRQNAGGRRGKFNLQPRLDQAVEWTQL
jgi:hypothetical protein